MPEGQYVKAVAFGLVVDEVADSAEKEATNAGRSRSFISGAEAWLFSQQGDGFADIGADGVRCGGTVCRPPFGGSTHLTCCSG
jgi:hypothetical protein